MEKIQEVKISQLKVVSEPNVKIVISEIVAGVSIIMYDPVRKLCGALHVILPRCFPGYQQDGPKFADTAIPMLLDALIRKGADKERLIVTIVGGAEMLSSNSKQLGANNVSSAKETLNKLGLTIANEDTGKHFRRDLTVSLDNVGHKIQIKKLGTAPVVISP